MKNIAELKPILPYMLIALTLLLLIPSEKKNDIRRTPVASPTKQDTEDYSEKRIYNHLKLMLVVYEEQVFIDNEQPTGDQLDQAEQQAINNTSENYDITPEKVIEIWEKYTFSK